MNVTVNLTSEEFVEFGMRQSTRGPKKMYSPTFIGVEIVFFILLAIYLFTTFDPDYALQLSAISLLIFAVVYVTVIIIPFIMTKGTLMDNFKKSASAGKEMRFSFTESGFIYRTDDKETIRNWEDIFKVAETEKTLGIFTAKANVYLIPKRCFENDDFRELREMIYNAMPHEKLNFL